MPLSALSSVLWRETGWDQLLDLVAFLERHCGLMVSAGAWVSAGPGAFTNKHYAGFLAFLNLSILMKRG